MTIVHSDMMPPNKLDANKLVTRLRNRCAILH